MDTYRLHFRAVGIDDADETFQAVLKAIKAPVVGSHLTALPPTSQGVKVAVITVDVEAYSDEGARTWLWVALHTARRFAQFEDALALHWLSQDRRTYRDLPLTPPVPVHPMVASASRFD